MGIEFTGLTEDQKQLPGTCSINPGLGRIPKIGPKTAVVHRGGEPQILRVESATIARSSHRITRRN